MAGFGVLFAGAVYWPLRHRGQLPVIISTIGASILLANTVLAAYGPSPQVLPGLFDDPGFDVGGVFMDSQYCAILVITAAAGAAAIPGVRKDAARQEAAGDQPGQGNGEPARHPRGA